MTNEKDLAKMTPDTERAIKAIKPLCDALRIDIEAPIDFKVWKSLLDKWGN